VQLGWHAGLVEAKRVVDVFVAEAVEGADGDERRRQAGEVDGPRRRCVGGDVVATVEIPEIRAPAERVRLA
jgi:hypothetical protein